MSSTSFIVRRWRTFLAGAVTGGVVVGIAALALTHLTGNVGKENEITTENNTNNNDYDNEADDECLSLYYHNHVPEDGSGIPNVGTCSEEEIAKLKMVHDDYRRLPIEFYQKAVGMLPILCVDVICRRKSDGKILLFLRRDAPAANIWWWPGGRMFRGETFFEAAIRKAADETGSDRSKITPRAVIKTWNTFFPDSNWDADRQPGYEGTQTVNTIVLCDFDGEDIEQKSGSKEQWAVDDYRWVSPDDLLVKGAYDKYVQLNVAIAKRRGLV